MDASPVDVVAAFIRAIDGHDVQTARSLLTAERAAVLDRAPDSWFFNIVSITDLKVGEPVPRNGDRSSLAHGYRQAVHVPAEFTLRQRQAMSIPDGHVIWGYLLVRNADDERWLIFDEGPV